MLEIGYGRHSPRRGRPSRACPGRECTAVRICANRSVQTVVLGCPESCDGPADCGQSHAVARLDEALNLRVVGSIPTRLTNFNLLIPHDRNLDPK